MIAFFDFTQLDTSVAGEQGVWVPVLHPVTKKAVPGAELLIASYDSEHAKEQRRKLQKRRARLGRPMSPEEIEEDALVIVCSIILDWRGIAWQGQELGCTLENKTMMLGRLDWLRRFADDRASETQLFLPPSPTPPSNSQSTNGDSANVPQEAS
jgi:hypothetical protein